MLEVAAEAERIGLDSVWSWERLMRPTVPIARSAEPAAGHGCTRGVRHCVRPDRAAYVAAQASRITPGTSVLDALFQSPIILARRLATLNRLSDGRLVVGVGQGWMEQEFQAAGVSMKRRGAGSRNTSWPCEPSGDRTPSASRAVYRIPEADIGPKPVQPGGPQLMAGAGSTAAAERAERLGVD
jgi:alkanesulfonate monooxygenase SsuD/methylene tetrahydromethanopterin reductase-like flavin-dependent oxidoreductase (luciferase family)